MKDELDDLHVGVLDGELRLLDVLGPPIALALDLHAVIGGPDRLPARTPTCLHWCRACSRRSTTWVGGMATSGILGMFLGATLLALSYQILKGWVTANPNAD